MMKKLLIPLAASLIALLATSTATAGQKYVSESYVSGRTSCGCPVYSQQYIAGFNRFGHPVYRQRSLPVRHRCQPVRPAPRHYRQAATICRTPAPRSTPYYHREPIYRRPTLIRRCR